MKYVTFKRLGKVVKRRTLSKKAKAARNRKFKETIASRHSQRTMQPNPQIQEEKVTDHNEDALIYLKQGERMLMENIRAGLVKSPDEVHLQLLLALRAMREGD